MTYFFNSLGLLSIYVDILIILSVNYKFLKNINYG